MPTNNYILTPDWNFISADELIYSRNIRYIDLDTDEMMHWKYIKRVKLSNGKYRYYYDEKDNHLTELKKGLADKENGYKNKYRESSNQYVHYANGEHYKGKYDHNKETARADLFLRRANIERHRTTGKGRVDAYMEKHGNEIARSLNKLTNAIYKGKSKIERIFKKFK